MFSQLTVYSLSKQSNFHSNLIWQRVIGLFILLSFPLCPRGSIQREKRSGISVSFQSLWNVDRLLLSRCPRHVHVMAADIIYQFIKHNPEGIRCWCQVSPQHLKFWSIIYLESNLRLGVLFCCMPLSDSMLKMFIYQGCDQFSDIRSTNLTSF